MVEEMSVSRSPWVRWGLIAALAVHLCDRFTKWWVLNQTTIPQEVVPVFKGLNLVLVWNHGVSFGMFAEANARYLLIALTLAVTAYLCVWMWKEKSYWTVLALGLIIGGATGNIVDRIYYHAVVDFLDVYAGVYHWPAFNVADSGICVGVMLLIAQQCFSKTKISSM